MTPRSQQHRRPHEPRTAGRDARRRRHRYGALGLVLTLALWIVAAADGEVSRSDPSSSGVSSSGAAHAHGPMSAEAPLPGASLYHLDAEWTDHRSRPLRLAELRGHPVIVVMIYASCETACPILIRDAARIDEALPPDVREDTRVLVVSFDPERDAPDRLAAYVASSDLGDARWSFAVGEPHATRALAALLGVRYRPVGDGMFSHSNLITVLGPDGVARQRSEGLGQPVEPAVDAVVAAYQEAKAR